MRTTVRVGPVAQRGQESARGTRLPAPQMPNGLPQFSHLSAVEAYGEGRKGGRELHALGRRREEQARVSERVENQPPEAEYDYKGNCGRQRRKLGLPGEWVKKTQPFENLIKFCIWNFSLAAPSACFSLLPRSWALWPQGPARSVGQWTFRHEFIRASKHDRHSSLQGELGA